MDNNVQNGYNSWLIAGAVVYVGYKILQKKILHISRNKQMMSDVTRMIITDKKININGNVINVSFKINNPNNHAIIIRAIVGTITFQNNVPDQPNLVIGDLEEFRGINILPLHATPVDLHFRIRQANALIYAVNTMLSKTTHTKIIFKGTINANGSPFPIIEQIQLT